MFVTLLPMFNVVTAGLVVLSEPLLNDEYETELIVVFILVQLVALKCTVVRLGHFQKACSPIEVTPSLIVTSVSDVKS